LLLLHHSSFRVRRLLNMYRTFVIARHTFKESVVQPIYSLLLGIGAAVLMVFAVLPFFTLGEDAVMYKSVALDVILLPVLIATLFATSKSIYEEIEDRTMLTLMSKPVRRWEVLIGKYFGIIASALMAILILGAVLALCLWFRVPGDYQLSTRSVDEFEIRQLHDYRLMHVAGALTSLVGVWVQIAVLAAVSVALSTRFSLVVNLPTVIILYIGGNLSRFLDPAVADRGPIAKGVAWGIKTLFPYLEVFDLKQKGVHATIALPGSVFAGDTNAIPLSSIWADAGLATIYAACYATAALAIGLLLFQTRELGGAEG
jgi:ABC-type transport system involved in multi-copper enzyme maturation permease subunit